MRDIKFRAWDGQKMWFDVCVMYGKWWDLLNDRAVEGYPIMQSTGLCDNNGDLIYEHDIVKFIGGTCHVLSDSNYYAHKIGTVLIVKYLESGFTLTTPEIFKSDNSDIPNLIHNVGQYTFWNHHRSLLRIGNIYDNADLLK